MDKTTKISIGIDLGGTRIKAVAIDDDGSILKQSYCPTNDGNETEWKNAVKNCFLQLKKSFAETPVSVGLSAPGLPAKDNKSIAFMPGRLEGLENFVWEQFFELPAFVLNDAVAALVAEAKSGTAVKSVNAVMITLGTGVGGALLIHGQPFQGSFNKAGHIGHMVVDSEGEPDITGMPGSLEDCIGNCSILKRTEGKFSSTRDLLAAMREGDAFASDVWERSVKKLAIALASVSNLISPDTIIIGGGIAEAGEHLFVPLSRWFNQFEWQPGGIRPQIVKAEHGDLAGAIGAAFFALGKMNAL